MPWSKKATLEAWNEAVISHESGDINAGLRKFQEIPEPTAKILFNISQGLLSKGWNGEAIEILSQAVEKDSHMAVGYFQRGTIYLNSNRFSEAEKDFLTTIEILRGKGSIDYKQLGLSYKISTVEVYYICAICKLQLCQYDQAKWYLEQIAQHQPNEKWNTLVKQAMHSIQVKSPVPVSSTAQVPPGLVFKPPQSAVANLKKKDYLGKAKVVSSLEPESKDETSKVRIHLDLLRKNSHSAPNSPLTSRKNASPRPARPSEGPHLSKNTVKSGSSTCLPSKVKKDPGTIFNPPQRPTLPLKSNSQTDIDKTFHHTLNTYDREINQNVVFNKDISRPPVPSKYPPRLPNKSEEKKVNSITNQSTCKWSKPERINVAGSSNSVSKLIQGFQSVSIDGHCEKGDSLGLDSKAKSQVLGHRDKSPVSFRKPPLPAKPSSSGSGGGFVMATFQCDSETSTSPLQRGSTLRDATQKASQKFGYPVDSISLWWQWAQADSPMYIENEASMSDVWMRLEGDCLHLQVYGKPSS